ncbi:MAG: 3'-5' exonuclease [Bacteroidota bacterium]
MPVIPVEKILFLDIETVPQYPTFQDVPEPYKALWTKKALKLIQKEGETDESIYPRAGIYSEFGKIICISVGYLHDGGFRIKSLANDDEKSLLIEFSKLLDHKTFKNNWFLCAHNGKEFDFPYISRRMLILGIHLPALLNITGKKPWETPFLDTMEMWKFGDYKNYTSLELMAAIFHIPTPKDDIDGSKVAAVYWNDNNLQRIASYCNKDVITIFRVYLRLVGKPDIEDLQIFYI